LNRTIIIKTEQTKDYAREYIKQIPLDPLHAIKVFEYKEIRSVAQNSLYWLWNTEVSNDTGETKDEVHERHKGDFLVRIYARDDTPEGYTQTLLDIPEVGKRSKKRAQRLLNILKIMTSTTTATIPQFTEYLQDIERFYIDQNFSLPHPEDRYYLAMGIPELKG
jgi:hypothetical protein